MLNEKLSSNNDWKSKESIEVILKMIPSVCQIISQFDVVCSSESLLGNQSGLVRIKILARVLTKEKSLEFVLASAVICLMLTKLKSKLN